ncbi:MAG: Xaa-Pro peptidase family protein [Bacillota bacterium]
MKDRLNSLRADFEAHEIDAMLITSPLNRRYLTGFTGSAGTLLVTTSEAYLVVDSRYHEQAREQVRECVIVPQGRELTQNLRDLAADANVGRLGFESENVSYGTYRRWTANVSELQWIPITDMVETLRLVKDDDELEAIRRAASIADEAFEEILPTVRAGRTEAEIALDLEFCARRLGAEGLSFPLIVASGERSSLPHGRASERQIRPGDFITFDYGVVYDGYCSDATRTIAVGEPGDDAREVYQTVLSAQLRALDQLRPGKTGFEIDSAARCIIEDAGFGDYFGHGLGHGVGLAVHEGPRLSYMDANEVLKPGMVVTVEPGIYLPSRFGVRIEDLVVVTDDGAEILTTPTKELVVNEE